MFTRRKSISNLEVILPLLNFSSKDDFYYLQIIQRKKENDSLKSNSRVIKNYYITSKRQLEDIFDDEIIEICEVFNARAMIRLNKRSFVKVALKALVNVGNVIANGEHQFVRKAYDRACGKGNNDPVKKWILDVDGQFTEKWVDELEEFITNQKPVGEKIKEIIPSKTGVHFIVKPFDTSGFTDLFPEVEIHKDNPTNLFIP